MIGNKVITFDELDSTNKYIKLNKNKLHSGTVIVAKHQTAGYGRLNRIWHDNVKDSLTFSVYLSMLVREDVALLTQLVAASVYNVLDKLGINTSIKWPNDIIVGHKKICGILVETIIENDVLHIMIGVGINVNTCIFKNEISDKATSIILETGIMYKVEEILNSILVELDKYYLEFLDNNMRFLDVCRTNSYLKNKTVRLNNGVEAIVKGIDDLGRLIVDIDGKEEKYFGSEVTLSEAYNT